MDINEIKQAIREIVAEVLEINVDELPEVVNFKDGTYNLDSLQVIEIVEVIEEHYDNAFRFEDSDMEDILTLDDLCRIVAERLKATEE